jgi:nucleotide-binding universal stress UspA family protein
MKKILVPLDFSEHSEYALEVAATLAKKHSAEIRVLHMMGLSEAVYTNDESQKFAEAQYYMRLAKKRFDTFEPAVAKRHQDYQNSTELQDF